MPSTLRLKAESTSIKGDATEVKLTVECDSDWTLTANNGGTFSASSGQSSGDLGLPVKFIMPVNCSTSAVTYTVTLTKAGTSETVSVEITQRKATENQRTTTFEAHQDFWKNSACTATDSKDYITATFNPVPGMAGSASLTPLDPNPYRWDFATSPTLELSTGYAVKKISQVDFKFHCLVEEYQHFIPSDITIVSPDNLISASDYSVTDNSSLLGDNSNWTLTLDSSLTLNGFTMSLIQISGRKIGMRSFTVTYTYYTWE